MLRILVAVVVMALWAQSAPAADSFAKGVYLQSEELCAQAKKDGLQTVIDAGNILLTTSGLESIEYNCEFVQVSKATRSPAWVVTAVCQEPGYLFPDVLSIVEMTATQLDLVSVRPVDDESGSSGNGGSYYLCDGVAMP